jgi:uncharacterized surface protein with fasciclin (FAS1) repeats
MFSVRRLIGVVAGMTLAAGTTLAVAPSASASVAHAPSKHRAAHSSGTTPLASVLLARGSSFDRNSHDYDILTNAVLAVLDKKPNSPVKVLTDGKVALTAFIPNDRAFRILVRDVTGKWYWKESDVFKAVAGLGIDTVETVLLYHVVPGATIDARTALKSNGAALKTAQGGTVTVKVRGKKIRLVDADKNDRDPRVIAVNINKGNKQIAHGIDRVLRPVDLP